MVEQSYYVTATSAAGCMGVVLGMAASTVGISATFSDANSSSPPPFVSVSVPVVSLCETVPVASPDSSVPLVVLGDSGSAQHAGVMMERGASRAHHSSGEKSRAMQRRHLRRGNERRQRLAQWLRVP